MSVVGSYNVIGLFAGHTHRFWTGSLTGTDATSNKSISFDSISDGSGGDCGSTYCSNGNGDFLAVHVTDRYMEVGAVMWNASIPGLFTLLTGTMRKLMQRTTATATLSLPVGI